MALGHYDQGLCALARRADLDLHRFSHEEITRMWEQEASPLIAESDRCELCFALGRALEGRGEYELACLYHARGKRLRRQLQSEVAASPRSSSA